jgi:TldD protein
MVWRRRDVLKLLAASGVSPVLGCVPTKRRARQLESQTKASSSLDLLRQAADRLAPLGDVTIRTMNRVRRVAFADGDGDELFVGRDNAVSVAVDTGDHRRREVSSDFTNAELERMVGALEKQLPARRSHEPGPGRRRHFGTEPKDDPAHAPPRAWRDGADALHSRLLRLEGSQIVYRGASLATSDVRVTQVTPTTVWTQRLVRSQALVTFAARSGEALRAHQLTVGGGDGLSSCDMSDEALEEAAAFVRSGVTQRRVPEGNRQVILSPRVASMFLARCIAPPLCMPLWRRSAAMGLRDARIGSDLVSIVDSPTAALAFGTLLFDARGYVLSDKSLVDKGLLLGPVDHVHPEKDFAPQNVPASSPSNLQWVSPSDASDPQQSADSALLIEAPVSAHVDPSTWRFSLVASRAKAIRGGRLTGRTYGEIELTGIVPDVLRAVVAIGPQVSDPVGSCFDDGGPSIATAPAIVTTLRVTST